MKKRRLGSSDLDVTEICLGTMNFGQQVDEAGAHKQLSYAVDEGGVNFIDTAEVYPIPPDIEKQGFTEQFVGSWLKKHGKRDELIIATKVAASQMINTRDPGHPPHYDRKSIREAIDGSLKRLQTDYVDLYQVHYPERVTNFFGVRAYPDRLSDTATLIAETLQALDELVKEGKVRYIGVSNETPWGVYQYLQAAKELGLSKIVSIQNQYSLTNRTFEIGLSEICLKENIGLLPYTPINGGTLTGKYLDGAKPANARFTLTSRNRSRYNPPNAQTAIRRYVELAKDNGLDPAQMALSFAMNRDFVSSVIIGATTMDQLKTDIDAASIKLSEKVMSGIDELYNEFPDVTA